MAWTVEVGSDLRRLFWRARKDKDRWGPRGLTQEEAAEKIGISPVWYRSIENGYQPTAALDTLTSICELFDNIIDPELLELRGYHDVAEELRERNKNKANGVSPIEDVNGDSDAPTLVLDLREVKRLDAEEQKALMFLVQKLRRNKEKGRHRK